MLDKQRLLDHIVLRLNEELQNLVQAAKAAHEAATHDESKAEDAHDTRGLEASYLAGAQAARAGEIQRLISVFKQLPIRSFDPDEAVAIGALIELETSGKRSLHLLAPMGGGISVQVGDKTVQIITPQAPLGDALVGREAGDEVEIEAQGRTREYTILKIS
jgi:transcription elongation GreA/GreB family factor